MKGIVIQGVMVIGIWFFSMTLVNAKSYIQEYTHTASNLDTKETSRVIALDQVKLTALKEIGTNIYHEINVSQSGADQSYVKEEINAVSAGHSKVIILEEKWDGKQFYLKAIIEADPKAILEALVVYKRSNSVQSRRNLEALKQNEKLLSGYRADMNQIVLDIKNEKNEQGKILLNQKYASVIGKINLVYIFNKGYELFEKEQYEESLVWFKQAADKNYTEALYFMGFLTYHGHGITEDKDAAVTWFKKAAADNHGDAQTKLGSIYDKAGEVEQAIYWYRKGVANNDLQSQFFLGTMYQLGEDLPQDYSMAFDLYQKSANQGFVHAQDYLAGMYASGNGVNKDIETAFKWYLKAAKNGLSRAQHTVATMYMKGEAVEASDTNAYKFFKLAAFQDHAKAQFFLAALHMKGRGVAKNIDTAKYWFNRACENGDAVSCKYR